MESSYKVDPATFIAPYVTSCYNDSLFCDLIIVCEENKVVSCHKVVLCSLSKKLLSICNDFDQAGDIAYVHLPDFSHKEVKETLDEIYACVGKKKVEIKSTNVISVLGIESATLKVPPLLRKAVVKTESQDDYFDDDNFPTEDMTDMIKAEVEFQEDEDESNGNFNTRSSSTALESLDITKYHDYTGTRQEFWNEHNVKVLLKVSLNNTLF